MAQSIAFVSDIGKFNDLRYRNKPIIAQFYTEWCPPCKPTRAYLEKQLRQSSGKFTLACINCDESDQLNIQYQIEGVPTVIAFSCDQKLTILDKIVGYDQKRLKQFVENVKKQTMIVKM